jgi:hypothetical protein
MLVAFNPLASPRPELGRASWEKPVDNQEDPRAYSPLECLGNKSNRKRRC